MENTRSARWSRVVLSKLLSARKAILLFISALARQKIAVRGMLANVRKDHSSPLLETAYLCETGYPFDDSRH